MSPFVRDGDLGIFYHLEKPRTGEVVLYKDSDGKVKPGRIAAVGDRKWIFQRRAVIQSTAIRLTRK